MSDVANALNSIYAQHDSTIHSAYDQQHTLQCNNLQFHINYFYVDLWHEPQSGIKPVAKTRQKSSKLG